MQQLMQVLAASPPKFLYHFTDTRNLAGIRTHGLLSLREIRRRGIAVEAYGGDEQSRRSDTQLDLDRYVHLSLLNQHPMELRARERGSIEQVRYVQVLPEVLNLPGVMFCPVVSTTGVPLKPIADVDSQVDFDVAFTRLDWKDPEVQQRLQAMRKFEILVPDHVAIERLRNL